MSNLFGLRVDLVSRMDPADLANDQDLVEALLGNYTVLGEATNGLSDSVKSKNSDVGWDDPVRLRNRIVHGYWSIELDVLASTAHEDLPQLEAAGSNPASPTNQILVIEHEGRTPAPGAGPDAFALSERHYLASPLGDDGSKVVGIDLEEVCDREDRLDSNCVGVHVSYPELLEGVVGHVDAGFTENGRGHAAVTQFAVPLDPRIPCLDGKLPELGGGGVVSCWT